jgi:hypothetical protein
VIDKKNFEKYKNQFIALREQVEGEIEIIGFGKFGSRFGVIGLVGIR